MSDEDVSVELKADSHNFVDSFNRAATATGHVVKGVGFVKNKFDELSNSVDRFAKRMIVAGGAMAIGNAWKLKGSVGDLNSFEASLNNISTVADTSAMSVGQIKSAIVDMTKVVPLSAKNLADGFYDIASSGFQGADALAVLDASAKTATAGLTDTATAASTISGILNAYGRSAKDAAVIGDILFKTVELGTLTFEDLAQSAGEWSSVAATLKVPVGEATAALAAMTSVGSDPAMASTQLKTAMQAFIAQSDGMKTAIGQLGFASGQAAVEQLGLKGAIDAVVGTTDGSTAQIQKLFQDVQGFNGVLQLTGAAAEKYGQFVRVMTDEHAVAGSVTRAFEKQMKGLSMQYNILKNQMQQFGMGVASYVIPPLKALVGIGIQLFSVMNALPGPFKAVIGLGGIFAGLFTALTGAAILYTAKVILLEKALLLIGRAFGISQALTFGNALGFITSRMRIFTSLLMKVGPIQALKQALVGIAIQAVATAAVLAALGFVVISFMNNMNSAKKAAEEYAASLRENLASNDIASTLEYQNKLLAERDRLMKTQEKYMPSAKKGILGSVFGGVKGLVDVSGADSLFGNDIKDSIWDAKAAIDATNGSLDDAQRRIDNYNVAMYSLMQQTGLTKDEILKLADSMNIDLTDLDLLKDGKLDMPGIKKIGDDMKTMEAAAKQGPQAIGKLDAAIDKFNSTLSTGEDRLDAYGDMLDRIIGKPLDLADSQADAYQSLRDLADVLDEVGPNFDRYSEGGAKVQSALSGAARSAMDMAQATYEQTGDINLATGKLWEYIGGVQQMGAELGLSSSQINDMLVLMGLTPTALETFVKLNGAEAAIGTLGEVTAGLSAIDGSVATATVQVNQTWTVDPMFTGGVTTPANTPPIIGGFQPGGRGSGGRNTRSSSGGGGGGGSSETPEEAAAKARDSARQIMDAMEETGHITRDFHKQWLQDMLAETTTWSQEYMDIWHQIQQIDEDVAKEAQEAKDKANELAKAKFQSGEINADAYIAHLYAQIRAAEANSIELYNLLDELAGVLSDVQQSNEDAKNEAMRVSKTRNAVGELSDKEYLGQLRVRLAGLEKYSEEWFSIWNEINSREQDMVDEERDLARWRYDNGKMSKDQYLDMLNARLAGLKAYSSEWRDVMDEITSVEQQAADDIKAIGQSISDAVKTTFGEFTEPIKKSANIFDAFNDQAPTGDQIRGYYTHVTTGVTRWIDAIKTLRSSGMDGGFVQSLIRQGPSSLGLAEAIIGMGAEGVGFINGAEANIRDMTNQFGNDMTSAYSGTTYNGDVMTFTTGDISIEIPASAGGGAVTPAMVQTWVVEGLTQVAKQVTAGLRG